MEAPARVHGERTARSWLATSLTGVALLALVTVHMIAHHFVVDRIGGLRTYRQVIEYIANPMMFAVESAFIVVVTWHGMLGLRAVLLDLHLQARTERVIRPGIVVLGVLTVGYGFLLIGTLAARA
jgi:succinate dehydrogenase hydrophobic anchor subunit